MGGFAAVKETVALGGEVTRGEGGGGTRGVRHREGRGGGGRVDLFTGQTHRRRGPRQTIGRRFYLSGSR